MAITTQQTGRRGFKRLSSLSALAVVGALGAGALFWSESAPAQGNEAYVEIELPENIERLTYFGSRAAWAPDSKRVAFVRRGPGDVYEIDIETREIRSLTSHFPHSGFFRVHFMANGDYILTGPRAIKTPYLARYRDTELWLLDKDLKTAPVRLNQHIHEAVATSRDSMLIAWTERNEAYLEAVTDPDFPGVLTEPDDRYATALYLSEVTYEDGVAQLTNTRMIRNFPSTECTSPEAQDFRDGDREIIVSCSYRTANAGPIDWSTLGVDIETAEITTYRREEATGWEEVEGIAPDGSWTLVECGPEKIEGELIIDLCRLDLEPSSPELHRVTYLIDQNSSATNPVVSPDGQWIAFQEVPDRFAGFGAGDGLLLMSTDVALGR